MTDTQHATAQQRALDELEAAAREVNDAQAALDAAVSLRRQRVVAARDAGVSNRRMFLECASIPHEMQVSRDLRAVDE